MSREVCVIGYARTPIGGFGGALKGFKAPELGTIAIKAAIDRACISENDVDEVFMGNVVSAGQGQAPARQAALDAGIPVSCPATTINKVCASGMKATALGAMMIRSGDSEVVVTGGFESMTNIPFYSKSTRLGNKLGDSILEDGLGCDGLRDRLTGEPMGCSGTLCAVENEISREDQDRYSARSYQRAIDATKQGKFNKEIVPIEISSRGKSSTMYQDEEPFARRVSYDMLKQLPAAFKLPKDCPKEYYQSAHASSVTAGSSSVISDGAAALVLCSRSFAESKGIPVIAVIENWADAAVVPARFPEAPIVAMTKVMKKANVTVQDVDLFEVNEAFSVVPLIASKHLGIDQDKMNIYGGAISIGHPLGCSGARIICTMISALTQENKSLGCLGICNGGGGAGAMLIRNAAIQSAL